MSRQELYSLSDLALLHADTVRGEFDRLLGSRVRLVISGATSRQERVNSSPLWQTTVSSGFAVQF